METNKRSGRVKIVLILALILFMPGFFYYFLKHNGTNQYASLPYYGSVREDEQEVSAVPSFRLLNDEGDYVIVPFQDSTVSVVNFFFTRCPQFCGRMNLEMRALADRFSRSSMVEFYSLSLDFNDSSDDLAAYIRRNDFGRDNWHFYTGDTTLVSKISRDHYLLDGIRDTSRDDIIIHTPLLVLLDSENYIRGYYNSTNKKEIERLQDELMVIITEARRKQK